MENTFTYHPYQRDGQVYHILTANEYPWMNLQIITFEEEKHDPNLAKIKAHPTIGWVVEVEAPGRGAFARIHARANKVPLEFNQQNYRQIAQDMELCMGKAAAWWPRGILKIKPSRYFSWLTIHPLYY